MILDEIVQKYGVTNICEDGSCYEVDSEMYAKNKYKNVGEFEIEEDFLTDIKIINIK